MTAPVVRAAQPEEAAEIAALLRRSITELCAADHRGDPAALAEWLANKTPEAVAAWIADPAQHLVVAEIDGRLAGVAAAHDDGTILLNYVSPRQSRRGASTAGLAVLEAWLRAKGVREARLESTATAHDFYRAHGFRDIGPPVAWRGADAYPMRKGLAP